MEKKQPIKFIPPPELESIEGIRGPTQIQGKREEPEYNHTKRPGRKKVHDDERDKGLNRERIIRSTAF